MPNKCNFYFSSVSQPAYGINLTIPIGTTVPIGFEVTAPGTWPIYVQNSSGVQVSPGSFVVTAFSSLGVSPTSLSFLYQVGTSAPAPQDLALTYTGIVLGFVAGASQTWLSVAPTSGSTPATLSVSVAATGLAPGVYTGNIGIYAWGAGNGSQNIPVTLTVTACSVTSVQIGIAAKNPNIVLAGGSPTAPETDLASLSIKVQPPAAEAVSLTPSFGTAPGVITGTKGTAIATYTAGQLLWGDTKTTVATISASACGVTSSTPATVLNYNGYNFRQSQVSNSAFTDATAMNAAQIQSFFETQGPLNRQPSFLANFYFVGQPACSSAMPKVPCGGFIDKTGTGIYKTGDPTYLSNGVPIPVGTQGTQASAVLAAIALGQEGGVTLNPITPQVLLTELEKEQGLISATSLPSIKTLNCAMGCLPCGTSKKYADFQSQLVCGSSTLTGAFNRLPASHYPVFLSPSSWGPIYQAVTVNCVDGTTQPAGCDSVMFFVDTQATFAQYRYTPFMQQLLTPTSGGGEYRFEQLWLLYGF